MQLSSLIKQASPFVEFSDEYVEKLIQEYSIDPNKKLFYNEHGFLAALLTDQYILLPGIKIALEIAWWVQPEYRNKRVGGLLYKEFEEWAKLNDAKYIILGKNVKHAKEIGKTYLLWVQN